jgi:hypothetical protein
MNAGFPAAHTGPEITGWSPVESERPPTLDSWRPAGHQPPCGRWCDVTGAQIFLFCQVEQVAEGTEPTVLASRLHQHGRVVGRNLDSLYVCFSDHQTISVRSDLLRVLDTDPDGD